MNVVPVNKLKYFQNPTNEDHERFLRHFKMVYSRTSSITWLLIIVGIVVFVIGMTILFVPEEEAKIVSIPFIACGIMMVTISLLVRHLAGKPLRLLSNNYTFINCVAYDPCEETKGDSTSYYAIIQDYYGNELESKIHIDRNTYNFLINQNFVNGELLKFGSIYTFLSEVSYTNYKNCGVNLFQL